MLSRRLFSTTARRAQKAHFTKLPNGLAVITKLSNQPTSSVGLYLNSGSRAENPYNSGVSTLLGKLLSRSPAAEAAFAKSGVKYTSDNGKELSAVAVANFAPGSSKVALESLKDIVASAPELVADEAAVKEESAKAAAQADLFEANPAKMVVEHLSATAFQGSSLALPSYGKADTLATLHPQDLARFLGKNLVASNAALVSVGSDLDHEALVSFAKDLAIPDGARLPYQSAPFLGSEVRLRDDTIPAAHVSIAVRVPGGSSEHDYYTGLVASAINGEYKGVDDLYAPFSSSKLAQITHAHGLSDAYRHFQHTYSDTGLWGFYFVSSQLDVVDEAVHFTLKNWNRLTTGSVSNVELQSAKEQLKVALTGPSASASAEAKKLADTYFTRDFLPSDDEIALRIDGITHKQVQNWASDYLYDQDIAVAGNGSIEALLDYNRTRNDMSMMRW